MTEKMMTTIIITMGIKKMIIMEITMTTTVETITKTIVHMK